MWLAPAGPAMSAVAWSRGLTAQTARWLSCRHQVMGCLAGWYAFTADVYMLRRHTRQ